MCVSGAQDRMDKNPSLYRQLLDAEHNKELKETINMGRACRYVVQDKKIFIIALHVVLLLSFYKILNIDHGLFYPPQILFIL